MPLTPFQKRRARLQKVWGHTKATHDHQNKVLCLLGTRNTEKKPCVLSKQGFEAQIALNTKGNYNLLKNLVLQILCRGRIHFSSMFGFPIDEEHL